MMKNRKGFTLLELLIAAALMGVLAMFATQAFRASSSDVRLEDAKARASLLFSAAQRYYIEYPGAKLFKKPTNLEIVFTEPGTCDPYSIDKAQNLVDCGFLEYRQVAYERNDIDKTSAERKFIGYVNMWFDFGEEGNQSADNMKVCFKGKEEGRRILDECTYCTSGQGFVRQCPEEETV